MSATLSKVLFLISAFIALSFFLPSPCIGVTVSINSTPSVITLDPFTIGASVSGASNGTNYLRIDIYKDGSQNYFGETYNGSDWYSGSDYHQYLAIPIVNSQWSGSIQGSLGSPSLSQYDGNGTYKIRLRRYTSGGTSNATEADASSVVVNIVTPTPTPTSTPTDTPIPTSAPTQTYPTFQPTSTPVATKYPTSTTSPTKLLATLSPSAIQDKTSDPTLSAKTSITQEVLAQATEVNTSTPGQVPSSQSSFPFLGIVIMGIGILIVGFCGILLFRSWKERDNE